MYPFPPNKAACYVSSLLHMALERGDLAEAIAKARKLVELYQVGQWKNKCACIYKHKKQIYSRCTEKGEN